MGYLMKQVNSNFLILNKNKNLAQEAIKNVASCAVLAEKNYMWVDNNEVSKSKTLEEAFDAWNWKIFIDNDSGDVFGISFLSEKLGDEEKLFETIAPYVEKDSFIEMTGEEGDRWRWFFDGKNCKEMYAEIIWR